MGLMKHLYCLLWLFGLLSLINNSAAQSQSKRSSRITSSRTSFGTNVKSPSPSSSSSSNSNGVNFDCPEEFGYYPHPTDCTQYYVCVFGGALLESCTGGLMYSHELQTCDWPRNVGCEVVDSGDRDVVISKQQQQQQQPQHVPSRVRFGSSFTSPQAQQQPLQQQQQQQQVLKPTVPPQYHRQPPQVIQAQVQTIPPPPQLKVSPNPVITSRGQPKHLLDAQEEIAKLYADAHDSLPPVEEEESDRQQRVYRGQPSTVSQVQKDRDGILHQASINAIPSNDKYNSYNFGSQYRIESSSPSSSIHSQTATPANIFLQNIRPTPQQHQIQQQQPHEQQQQHHLLQEHQQVIVETIPSTQTQNQNHYRHQQQQQQLPPPLPTLAQPQPFSPNRNYYNITSVSTNYNNNNNHKNNNNNNHNVDVVSYIPQQQQQHQQQQSHQIIPQHSSQQQQQPQLIPQSDIQQSEQSPYDNYYSVYDDDIDLYRDIEYQQQQQHQQQQQQYQQPIRQSTYRPLDVFTTPAPQSAPRETYKPQPQPPRQQERPTYTNQQPLVYNSDYDEDLIAQIEQDNAYDQPTRPPPSSNRNRGSSSSSSNSYNQGDIGSAPVTSNRGTHPPRTRPTLKPSGTIVSKAQEFIDIYKNPPSRPEPLYPQPTPDKTAAKCRKDVCLLPDCYCGGKDIPGDLPVESVPQIVLITFDDSVNDLNKQLYIDLFEKGRVNPNGCPITATFYVSHEWTDYSQVQNLYADGHEMASHTVSHSFGEQFSQKKWTREVAGQREILAAYGGVKLSDVRGMRAPFLSVGGNKMFKMLYDSNFTYDSSMPVYENRPPSWPYTLDYKIFHDCMIPPCPTKSYPGVWQVPMVMWQDLNGGRCSMGDACSNPSEAEGVTKMIMKNFERHYTTNRAPFGLFYHAAWFTQPHHKEGFIKFLDTINAMPDVWIVTNWQALQWVRDPTPLSRINSFQPFQCDYSDRPKRCNNPKVCNLWHKSGVRYMKTCQPCPDIYPWTGKTGIRSSRIDNDIEDSTA
ncbi:chitin deacetylase-like 5 isoform X28 [Musca autumnalis]|uniref:chitin deacetylase-like 5 isoform X28 n=1 Tax=Musca autumnalis TaxID=221902 RepID=UPI003CF0423E